MTDQQTEVNHDQQYTPHVNDEYHHAAPLHAEPTATYGITRLAPSAAPAQARVAAHGPTRGRGPDHRPGHPRRHVADRAADCLEEGNGGQQHSQLSAIDPQHDEGPAGRAPGKGRSPRSSPTGRQRFTNTTGLRLFQQEHRQRRSGGCQSDQPPGHRGAAVRMQFGDVCLSCPGAVVLLPRQAPRPR